MASSSDTTHDSQRIDALSAKVDGMEQMLKQILEQLKPSHAPERVSATENLGGEPGSIERDADIGRKRKLTSIKDLKPPKFTGATAVRTTDAVENWLQKWEKAFAMCGITDDSEMIAEATYRLQESAQRWWRKVEKDGLVPDSWEAFRQMFVQNWVPLDEKNRAMQQWSNLKQGNWSVQEYADRYREALLRIPEDVPMFLQVFYFIEGLRESLRPFVRMEKTNII